MATQIEFEIRKKVSRGRREIFWAKNAMVNRSLPRPQPLLFLGPVSFLSPYLLLDSLEFGPQCFRPLRMLLLRLVESRLGLVDGLLPAFAFLLPGRLFLGFLTLPALMLAFVRLRGLLVGRLVGLRGRWLRLAGRRFRARWILPPP